MNNKDSEHLLRPAPYIPALKRPGFTVRWINKHSDLSVTWGPVKAGRPVVGVAFKIRKKTDIAAQNAREVHDVNKMLDGAKNEDHQFGDCDYVKPLLGQKSLNFSARPLQEDFED